MGVVLCCVLSCVLRCVVVVKMLKKLCIPLSSVALVLLQNVREVLWMYYTVLCVLRCVVVVKDIKNALNS